LETLSPVHSAAQRCEPEYMSRVRMNNDIGGFAQRPTAELMKRWLEVGALLPFARVHTTRT
jgi:Glycosyl hydrolases family 31